MILRGCMASSTRRRLATITELFAGGESGIILDPRNLGTMWQDVGKTVAVASDNDPVRVWEDARGGSFDFVAPSDAARPLWRDNAGSSYLEFNGSRELEYTGTGLNFGEITLSVRAESTAHSKVIAGFPHAASHSNPYFRLSLYHIFSGARMDTRWNGIASTSSATLYGSGLSKMVSVAPTTGKIWVDGAVDSSPTPRTPITYPNSQGVVIGANATSGERMSGKFYGMVVIDRSIDVDDAAILNAWNTA